MKAIAICALITLLPWIGSTAAASDLKPFFPSVPMSGDTAFQSHYTATLYGCLLTLTEIRPDPDHETRRIVSSINLAHHQTNRAAVTVIKTTSDPRARNLIIWPEIPDPAFRQREDLQRTLFQQALKANSSATARQNLIKALIDIKAGDHGLRAQTTYAAHYTTEPETLIDISLINIFEIAIDPDNVDSLIETIHKARQTHCP